MLRAGQVEDLISRRVRIEMRELAVRAGILRTINDAFEGEGFALAIEPQTNGGARRGLFDAYDQGIDWSDQDQVASAIRVFEEILSWGTGSTWVMGEDFVPKLKRLLRNDGYALDTTPDAQFRINPKQPDMPVLRSEHIGDTEVLQEYLVRLDGAIESDPALAIGQAKSLIEATSKWVLDQLGEEYNDKVTVPALVKKTQKALRVHPDTIAPSKKGRETIVRVLSNLSQVAVGVAELRNEYGPDHGRSRPASGLGPRHARLAGGAARTYCEFLLGTLNDLLSRDSAVNQSRAG